MPNLEKSFNPAYSTIKSIFLQNDDGSESVNILIQNSECVFERIEFVENVNDVLPNGVLVVKDTKDILSRIKEFKINKIQILFFDGKKWDLIITSASYINNAASDTEENFVGIYFSNSYYTKYQKASLNQLLKIKKPSVFLIHDLIDTIRKNAFDGATGYSTKTTNYALYRPLATVENRDEYVNEDPFMYLNYLSSGAVSEVTKNPDFMFWTGFDGSVNFKSFSNNPTLDPTFTTLQTDFRYLGIMEGDSVIQKLSDGKFYRKIYFYSTDPGYQFISKNYFYIRKTPKILDVIPPGITGATAISQYVANSLIYQYQDEGQKYNIEIIDHGNSAYALPGANQLMYTNHWGFYDGLDSMDSSYHTHIGKEFGTQNQYASLNLMGDTGYMQYVDNTEMWKNMFDLTAVHPNYSGQTGSVANVGGTGTKLQKVLDIRYNNFLSTIGATADRLSKIRNIEVQNFIMYSLCCMGKKNEDQSFFAALTEYQLDTVTNQPTTVEGNFYRYKWNKINFESFYGPSGPCGGSGASGSTAYYFHQLEKWAYVPSEASSATQDDSWAINLNERGLTGAYLPPGWISPAPTGFRLRPIGANTETIGACGSIYHIVKMYKTSLEELLLNSNNVVYPEYIGKYMYYFTAENAFDGVCVNTGSCGGNCGGNCGPSPEKNPETENGGGNPVSPTT
jgi:hypothetical protein